MNLRQLSAALCAIALTCLITLGCPISPDPVITDPTPASATPTPVPAATTGNITGKVTLNGASSSEGISICIEKLDGLVASSVAARANGSAVSRAMILNTTTSDANGNYSFADLEPATYTIYAVRSSSAEQAASTTVEVQAAVTVTAGDLNLTATGSVTGKITVDGFSTNIAGYQVCLAGTSWSATTDANGSFTISGVPVGPAYSVVILGNGKSSLLPATIAVTADTSTDLGTVAVSSYGGIKHAVNIVVTNIPADYAEAKITLTADLYVDSGDSGSISDFTSFESMKATVSNGTANMTLYLSDPEVNTLKNYTHYAGLNLYKSGSAELVARITWSMGDNPLDLHFLTDTYISANTGAIITYNVRITGFGDYGWSWATADEVNGKRILYTTLSQSTIDAMKANPGITDNFNLIAYRNPTYIQEIATWKGLAGKLGTASDILTLDFNEVTSEYMKTGFTFSKIPSYLANENLTSVVYTPTGSTPTSHKTLDSTTYGSACSNVSPALDVSVIKAMAKDGGTVNITFTNGAAYSWTVPAGLSMEAVIGLYLSYTDATIVSLPTTTGTYSLSTIASAGTTSVLATTIDALAVGYPFTPNKVAITYSVYSSSDWNLNMNAYISSGISPANYNLFATNGSSNWITNSTGYFVTGGYGTSFAGNTGGTPGNSNWGGYTLQCTNTVVFDYPFTDTSIGITVAADSSTTLKGSISMGFRLIHQ